MDRSNGHRMFCLLCGLQVFRGRRGQRLCTFKLRCIFVGTYNVRKMKNFRVPLQRGDDRTLWQNPCDTKRLLSLSLFEPQMRCEAAVLCDQGKTAEAGARMSVHQGPGAVTKMQKRRPVDGPNLN